ncbi:MAG TPA: STAS domain-containing protein [Solirubrobacterales bacterium]|jgi:anti-anti-sigma factor|nr:STAS domain-containing protein [Solirubrobacterales bacterium]
MTVQVTEERSERGQYTIRINGELDLATVSSLEAAVIRAIESRSAPMLIDLCACSFIDSSVIAALLRALARVDGHDGSRPSLVVAAQAQPLQVLRLTAVDERIPIFPTTWEAEQALSSDGHR